MIAPGRFQGGAEVFEYPLQLSVDRTGVGEGAEGASV